MANIVQQTSKTNHVNRSTFDLSGNINLTAAPGMLIPLRVDDVLPNSSYHFNMSLFARTIQMVVPSFARVRAHIDTFFVPYRLLGNDIPSVLVGDERGILNNYGEDGTFTNNNAGLPFISMRHYLSYDTSNKQWSFNFGDNIDAAHINYNVSTPILLNALGYGYPNHGTFGGFEPSAGTSTLAGSTDILSNTSATNSAGNANTKLSPLYLLAYQKIYQDHYRNKLWEKENRLSYYVRSSELGKDITSRLLETGAFEMRYHDYDKDRLTGVVPDENGILSEGISQYASTLLNASLGLDSPTVLGSSQIPDSNVSAISTSGQNQGPLKSLYGHELYNVGVNIAQAQSTSASLIMQQYTALTNKRMEAFQRFAEICNLNKSDYKHQIKAHFGFTPSDYNSDYSSLIGSFDVNLSISDVENTSSSDTGYLAGKGTMSGQSRSIDFNTASDYGCIMSILYILPQIDWSNEMIDRSVLRFNRYDFAIPEFDRLGFEPVRFIDWFGLTANSPYSSAQLGIFDIIGYLPRYWSYKTRLDVNSTGFTSSSKSALNFNSYIVQYDKTRLYDAYKDGAFFEALKSRPSDLDGLFPVNWSSVQENPFVITCYISCKAKLPLSIDSLPY